MNDPGKTTLRFFAYIGGKILAVLLALAFIVFAFFTAVNTMNVQVMLKDAFTLRSSVMLKQSDNDDVELISKVFSEEYIKNRTERYSSLVTEVSS